MPQSDSTTPETTEGTKTEGMSRRGFLKLSGTAVAGFVIAKVAIARLESVIGPDKASAETVNNIPVGALKLDKAAASEPVAEVPVVWLQAGACTGCAVTVLNTLSPRIQDVLVDKIVPGQHVSLRFHPVVMAAEGKKAMESLDKTVAAGGFVLVVEGGVSTKDNGIYCMVGEDENGNGITMLEHVKQAGSKAMAVIALGTCSAYGGIPAARPNPTGIKTVSEIFDSTGISTPVINVPGCPPNPDWFIGTLFQVLTQGLGSVKVDGHKRPLSYYGSKIHDNCPRRGYFDSGKFALKPGDPHCLYNLGCKGPVTSSDCPIRLWNSGTNWCIGCGHPCVGCVEPSFPDDMGAIFDKASGVKTAGINDAVQWAGIGLGAAALAGVGAHLLGTAASGRLKKDGGEHEEKPKE